MPALVIKDLSKTYGKSTIAVKNLNLTIPRGRILGLIGPNGAGKSTTINYIAGLVKPDHGELSILGDLIKPNDNSYKRHLGFVLEKPLFFEKLTGLEYLTFCGQMQNLDKSQIQSRSIELLRLLDLDDKADTYIEHYSHGMKKKISLAAAIIHAPKLLILDEPFEGIDPAAAKIIMNNLHIMKMKGKTILISSHNLDILENLCTDIAMLDKGEIKFQGTVDEIRAGSNETTGESQRTPLQALYDQYFDYSKETATLSWL